jgi:hypothetical protein
MCWSDTEESTTTGSEGIARVVAGRLRVVKSMGDVIAAL